MADPRKLAILLTSSLLIGACFSSRIEAQEKSKTGEKQSTASNNISTKQLEAWVNQLSEGNFRERRTASNNLSKVGKQALPVLVKGAQRNDAEVSARCVAIVIEMYQGKNKTLKSENLYNFHTIKM